MHHVSEQLLAGYVAGGALPGDEEWAVEGHLEKCGQCRARLSGAAGTGVAGLVADVWSGLEPHLAAPPQPMPNRSAAWLRGWATPVMVPWLLMVIAVGVLSVFLDHTYYESRLSFVQLFSPVLPVFGVAASWARGLDPAYELTAATPRAGLELVLRRTTAVLVPVLAVLLLAGWLTGARIGFGLLPSLAFTTGTLALGTFVGIAWAASILVGLWLGALVVPTVSFGSSVLLVPATWPGWLAAIVVSAVFVVLRRNTFTRLAAHH
ncbi:zf-HC2 domain-containing protein [Amycolatopsis benzoatilytica]|uniref:zf-HC2 domain-containing protein n=1 Tax=Amycolatopsis benzoatilytica TaxID=346045 RepID=UPI00037B3CC2|nr:zf-HC2 domain-containing protein [Amycolatopsis benzoatilytica]